MYLNDSGDVTSRKGIFKKTRIIQPDERKTSWIIFSLFPSDYRVKSIVITIGVRIVSIILTLSIYFYVGYLIPERNRLLITDSNDWNHCYFCYPNSSFTRIPGNRIKNILSNIYLMTHSNQMVPNQDLKSMHSSVKFFQTWLKFLEVNTEDLQY